MLSSLYGYLDIDENKRRNIFLSLFDYFKIDFTGKHVLDLGPGSGESLDIAKERGAVKTSFIDRDELIFAHCKEKGHTGHLLDYGSREFLSHSNTYDIIICRGALNADQWNRGGFEITIQDLICWMKPSFSVITPTFDVGLEAPDNVYPEVLSLNTHKHTCFGEKRDEYLQSEFHKTLLSNQYELTSFIEGYSHPHCFPFTYQHLFEH